MAIQWDIGGRVTRGFKVHPFKEWEMLTANFIMVTVVYTNNSAELDCRGVNVGNARKARGNFYVYIIHITSVPFND